MPERVRSFVWRGPVCADVLDARCSFLPWAHISTTLWLQPPSTSHRWILSNKLSPDGAHRKKETTCSPQCVVNPLGGLLTCGSVQHEALHQAQQPLPCLSQSQKDSPCLELQAQGPQRLTFKPIGVSPASRPTQLVLELVSTQY